MVSPHISEEGIQNYILEGRTNDSINAHLFTCEICKAQVEIYDALNRALKITTPEMFSFDVSGGVIKKIKSNKRKEKYLIYLFSALLIAIVSLITYLSYPVISPLLTTIKILSPGSIALVISVAFMLVFFMVTDMIRAQKEKILRIS